MITQILVLLGQDVYHSDSHLHSKWIKMHYNINSFFGYEIQNISQNFNKTELIIASTFKVNGSLRLIKTH